MTKSKFVNKKKLEDFEIDNNNTSFYVLLDHRNAKTALAMDHECFIHTKFHKNQAFLQNKLKLHGWRTPAKGLMSAKAV